jgi:hypothetical protein
MSKQPKYVLAVKVDRERIIWFKWIEHPRKFLKGYVSRTFPDWRWANIHELIQLPNGDAIAGRQIGSETKRTV